MTKRLLLGLVVGLVVLGVSSVDARAGQITLSTTLDKLAAPPAPAGEYVVNSTGLTFSSFTFSSSALPSGTPVLDASGVNVADFDVGSESGLRFSGGMFAPANATVDYKISYIVTAAPGQVILDSILGAIYDIPVDFTGLVSIGESLFDVVTGAAIGSLSVSNPPGTINDVITFAPVTSILVKKDIFLMGGTHGASVSILDQGFSTSAIPEPTSMALLGIGLGGLFSIRRVIKRTHARASG